MRVIFVFHSYHTITSLQFQYAKLHVTSLMASITVNQEIHESRVVVGIESTSICVAQHRFNPSGFNDRAKNAKCGALEAPYDAALICPWFLHGHA